MKILLDTNVIIDNLARRDEHGESLRILNLCEDGSLDGVITTFTIIDTMYVLRKYLGFDKIRGSMQMLMQIVDVVPILKSDINAALKGEFADFEDAVQASCATRIKADYIVARNIKAFINSPIKALLPVEFLSIL